MLRAISSATRRETMFAPTAVSRIRAKPSRFIAVEKRAGSTPGNSEAKLGATERITSLRAPTRLRTAIRSSRTILAWFGQVPTHVPQKMHASGRTTAWSFSTRMAFTGHRRTHL